MTRPRDGRAFDGPSILIVGGGSGGHISPGLAVAEAITGLGGHSLLLCSDRAIDAAMLKPSGLPHQATSARPFRMHPVGLLQCLGGIRASSSQARRVLGETRFDSVLALGGFVAAATMPGILAARRRARARGMDDLQGPILLLNLDRVPGRANRNVARKVDIVLTAVDTVTPGFASLTVGLPIRAAALAPADPNTCRRRLGLDPDRQTLLVTGASQGAASLNRLLLRLLDDAASPLKRWQVLHLSGTGGETDLQRRYDDAGVNARVLPFLEHMGLAWAAATVCLSRSGANSVGEIEANAVPSIFLPYPHHKDRHQYHNAAPLIEAKAAELVDDGDDQQTAARVAALLDEFHDAPRRLARMAERLKARSHPEAADVVASMLAKPL